MLLKEMPADPVMKLAVFAYAINTAYGSTQFASYLFKQCSLICTSRSTTPWEAFKALYKHSSLILRNFSKVHIIIPPLTVDKIWHKELIYSFSKVFDA